LSLLSSIRQNRHEAKLNSYSGQLFGREASIEWFRSELERQTALAWNRAVAAIADAIRGAEVEVREAARRDGYIR